MNGYRFQYGGRTKTDLWPKTFLVETENSVLKDNNCRKRLTRTEQAVGRLQMMFVDPTFRENHQVMLLMDMVCLVECLYNIGVFCVAGPASTGHNRHYTTILVGSRY